MTRPFEKIVHASGHPFALAKNQGRYSPDGAGSNGDVDSVARLRQSGRKHEI
jgi:hypothetical protein